MLCSASAYGGLAAIPGDAAALIVAGDPLLAMTEGRADRPGGTGRSRVILAQWDKVAEGEDQIFHPAALLRHDGAAGETQIITDHAGFVPVFWTVDRGGHVLASSPDLVAALVPRRLDMVAVREKAASGQIAYPFTLYEGICQVAPGAVSVFSGGAMESRFLWQAPARRSLAEGAMRGAIREALAGSVDRIFGQNAGPGHVTLSAGTDTRLIADILAEQGRAAVTCLSCSGAFNLEAAVARQVAAASGMAFRHVTRRPDHHARVLAARPYAIGTQAHWAHAHFWDKGLGELEADAFVIGAYLADTIVAGADACNLALDARGGAEDGLRGWATSPVVDGYSLAQVQEIVLRRSRVCDLLPAHAALSARTRRVFPATNLWTMAHFAALRMTYAAYEPFMCRPVFDLFAATLSHSPAPDKAAVLRPRDAALRRLPTNPDADPEIVQAFRKIRRLVPEADLPGMVALPGAWGEARTAVTDRFEAGLAAIVEQMSAWLGIDAPVLRRDRLMLYEIHAAAMLTGEGPGADGWPRARGG